MAVGSSTLAWRILWTEEPGGLQPWGHKESDSRTEVSTGCFHGKPQVSASLVRGRHLVGKDGNCRLSLCLTVSAGSLV